RPRPPRKEAALLLERPGATALRERAEGASGRARHAPAARPAGAARLPDAPLYPRTGDALGGNLEAGAWRASRARSRDARAPDSAMVAPERRFGHESRAGCTAPVRNAPARRGGEAARRFGRSCRSSPQRWDRLERGERSGGRARAPRLPHVFGRL